jgi:hypothetical protein
MTTSINKHLGTYVSFIKFEILDSYNCWTNTYTFISLETTNFSTLTLSELII